MCGISLCGEQKAGFKREKSALAPQTPRSDHTALLSGHSFSSKRYDVIELKRRQCRQKRWDTETSQGQD